MVKKRKRRRLKKGPMFILILLMCGCGYFLFNKFVNKDDIVEKLDTVVPKEMVDVISTETDVRNIAVMINNHPKARPYMSGLEDAFLIYEILVEGGYTRYMAIFNDKNTERIGSVRSARHYFLDYALENDAIYVHWGWSPQAESDIRTMNVNNINGLQYENTYFYRDTSLNVALEHTGFTSMEKIKNGIKGLSYNSKSKKDALLNYSVSDVDLSSMEGSIVANNIVIPYSGAVTNSYVYDPETKMYLRFVNDAEHKDYVTKEQYSFKNIITYKVSNTVIDNYGRLDISNIGSGEGYYITNGFAIPIKWDKSSRGSQTRYYFMDGKELEVSDGNTFIQIQPGSKTLAIS